MGAFDLKPRRLGSLILACVCLLQLSVAISATEKDPASTKPQVGPRVLDASQRSRTSHIYKTDDLEFAYTATAASLTVYNQRSMPIGRIFYIAYLRDQQNHQSRPLTFVFNGGPGAASAYLHLGALGPKRVVFSEDGGVLPMPATVEDNPKSWLAFTDLVFVDPVGTGYSRKVESDGDNQVGSGVWGVKEDAESLSRFVRAYLTKENRWLSSIYLVGESYGGFRAARLSRVLQTRYDIAPSGLILVSPVLDFSFLKGNEHSLWPWAALLPSYAAVAAVHHRSEQTNYNADQPRTSLVQVERYALSDYLNGLATGTFKPGWRDQTSRMIGLNEGFLVQWAGRVPSARFAKALLADQQRLVSLYDGSITLIDTDPAKQFPMGRDFYLNRLNASVTAAFNSYVRSDLDFKTDVPYLLLNKAVSKSWNWRSGIHGQQGFAEAASDLKRAMSQNPDMRVQIMHGVFDLVTPYFASEIIIRQMRLDSQIKDNLQLKVYHGGHMPYLHRDTLDKMFKDAAEFYTLRSDT